MKGSRIVLVLGLVVIPYLAFVYSLLEMSPLGRVLPLPRGILRLGVEAAFFYLFVLVVLVVLWQIGRGIRALTRGETISRRRLLIWLAWTVLFFVAYAVAVAANTTHKAPEPYEGSRGFEIFVQPFVILPLMAPLLALALAIERKLGRRAKRSSPVSS